MSELLRITNLRGGYKKEVDILRGIDLTVEEGEAVGIIGLNGSGKSTLGKAIMNMIPFRSGEFFFDGEDVSSLSTHELSRIGISIMSQGGRVFQNLSVFENLELAFSAGLGHSFEQLQEVIPMLKQSKEMLQHQSADKLSGGEKHQLALAMTMAMHPRLVILDEPSAGLSPKAVEELFEILSDARKELAITLLLIEQNVSKAMSFCDRSVFMQQGIIRTDALKSLDDIGLMYFKEDRL